MFEQLREPLSHWSAQQQPQWRLATWWRSDTLAAIQHSLLRLLEVAHRERLDAARLIDNFAEEHRGLTRRRLRQLARRLNAGTPLIEALEQTPEVLSKHDLLAIRFAIQSGTLASTYPHLLQRREGPPTQSRARLRGTMAYGVALALIACVIVAFLAAFVVPIFNRLEAELAPPSSGRWRTFSAVAARLPTIGLLLAVLLFIIGLLWSTVPTRRWLQQSWSVFGRRIATKSSAAELLRLLSYAIDEGRPVTGAVSTLARYHFDAVIRRKLLFVRNEVEHGADVWNCLAEARFVSPLEAAAIRQAESARLQAWTLRRLADVRTSQATSREEKIRSLVQPLMVLLFAAVVLLITSSFIQFLSQLIQWHAQT